jgi:hypothetical protein
MSKPDCEGGLPCVGLALALPELRRPPVPAAVRFKLQTATSDAGQVVAYVDARFVYDRLDLVCGEHWSARFGPLPRALIPRPRPDEPDPPPLYVRCGMTLFGVTRVDVGERADPKAAFSDAVKRAAFHFGVGRVLYALRAPWLRTGDADGELRPDGRGGLVLDERSEAWCRQKYERWLEERGAAEFGEPLAHASAPDDGCHGSGEGGDAPALRAAGVTVPFGRNGLPGRFKSPVAESEM